MIVVNLQQLGLVPHKTCSPEELGVVYEIAREIMGSTETDVLADILNEWETALIWRSLESQPVDEQWYYRALLLTCIRGLQGDIRPDFYTIP
jgi:hypothetical protein